MSRLTYKSRRILEDLLRPRLTMIGEGLCKYNHSGSDAHVAGEARMKGVDGCKPTHVAYVRQQMFGRLRPEMADVAAKAPKEIAVPGVVLDQLRDHEQCVNALNVRLTALETRPAAAPGVMNNLAAIERDIMGLTRDLNMVMEYLTRAHGVNWTMQEFSKAIAEGKHKEKLKVTS